MDVYHDHTPTNLSMDVKIIKKKANYLGIQEVVFDRDSQGDVYVRLHRWNSVIRMPGITSFNDSNLQICVAFPKRGEPTIHFRTKQSSITYSASWDSCLQEVVDGFYNGGLIQTYTL